MLAERAGELGARVDAEFVVAATDVLHQRVTADDHPCRVVAFESTHRTQSGFEPSVVAFDAVVRILLSVMKRAWDEVFDRGPQRGGPIGHDLDRLTVQAQRCREEPSCGSEIAAHRDEYVDDLPVLINGAVDVAPRAGDFDVGLVDVPTVADRMATWAGRVGGPFDPKHFDVAAVNVALQRLR